jgi:branched-chain amino acid transport system permease protein
VAQYVIAGLVLGAIYAIAAAGLVVTYLSAGILNFAFGAMAYFVARFFYFLNSQHHWSVLPAALLALVVVAPAMGVLLYVTIFRLLALSSPLIKVVVTLGISVALPPFAGLLFGNVNILKAPGLLTEPALPKVFLKIDGVPVTANQTLTYICVVLIVLVGAAVLRYTDVGLRVRAMVDSPAMTSLSGTDPARVSVGVWAASTFLAGLAGVLYAPIIGLNPGDFTLLIAAAFAAVIAAKLRSLPVAVGVGLGMGIAGALVQRYLPPASSFTAAIIPAIPFAVTAIFLLYNLLRWGSINETAGVGGALDRAIRPQAEARIAATVSTGDSGASLRRATGWLTWGIPLIVIAVLPILLHPFWLESFIPGVALGIVFLSFTLVTGEGGMIWLCQVTFAGVGALAAAQLATNHHWPVLAAILAGGVIATPMGVILGMLTIRLGDLYVALVTLTFGLLMESLVFSRSTFQNFGLGVNMGRPHFAQSLRSFSYLELAIFLVIAVLIVNLRRSTTGLALNAVRWSEPAAKTIGLSVFQMKVLVSGVAAFVAGIGGGLYAASLTTARATDYATLLGVVWLAVLVTIGIRSNIAALVAGLTFALSPALANAYFPKWFANFPSILFGLGAIAIAKNPEGAIVTTGKQIRSGMARLRAQRSGSQPADVDVRSGSGGSPLEDPAATGALTGASPQ